MYIWSKYILDKYVLKDFEKPTTFWPPPPQSFKLVTYVNGFDDFDNISV